MTPAIWTRVQTILADILQLPPADITVSSSPDTIESWDSLNHLNLVLAMEQEFAIHFTPEEIDKLISAQRITEMLEQKLQLQADGRPA